MRKTDILRYMIAKGWIALAEKFDYIFWEEILVEGYDEQREKMGLL